MKNTLALATLTLLCLPAAGSAQTDPETVKALFKNAFSESCFIGDEIRDPEYLSDESWELSWTYDYSDTPTVGTLYKFFCFHGAYNASFVFYFDSPHEGPTPVAFAVPSLDIRYENDDWEGAVESIVVRGFRAKHVLINAEFDPETLVLTELSRWRGLSDASSIGTWTFERGEFVLKTYEVDASYDGEIEHQRVVEFK